LPIGSDDRSQQNELNEVGLVDGEDGEPSSEGEDEMREVPDERRSARTSLRAKVMVVASGAALLATSAPETFAFQFGRTLAGTDVVLTRDAPSAKFRVNVAAEELAPNGQPTTNAALATVRGTVISTDVDTTVPAGGFVTVRVTHPDAKATDVMNAATQFSMTHALGFSGGCRAPLAGPPCAATFEVELTRRDEGQAGGSVRVAWGIDLRASVPKDEGPSVTDLDVPWRTAITAP